MPRLYQSVTADPVMLEESKWIAHLVIITQMSVNTATATTMPR